MFHILWYNIHPSSIFRFFCLLTLFCLTNIERKARFSSEIGSLPLYLIKPRPIQNGFLCVDVSDSEYPTNRTWLNVTEINFWSGNTIDNTNYLSKALKTNLNEFWPVYFVLASLGTNLFFAYGVVSWASKNSSESLESDIWLYLNFKIKYKLMDSLLNHGKINIHFLVYYCLSLSLNREK